MKAEQRAERDRQVLQLFVAGATYRQIAAAVGLRSPQSVDHIVKREMAAAAQRRALLNDEALAIYQERTEALFKAHWAPALKGDHRSAELCRRLLAQQARLYGLDDMLDSSLPPPTVSGGLDDDDDEVQDELARLRAQRAGA